jgi:hypothetical protein
VREREREVKSRLRRLTPGQYFLVLEEEEDEW